MLLHNLLFPLIMICSSVSTAAPVQTDSVSGLNTGAVAIAGRPPAVEPQGLEKRDPRRANVRRHGNTVRFIVQFLAPHGYLSTLATEVWTMIRARVAQQVAGDLERFMRGNEHGPQWHDFNEHADAQTYSLYAGPRLVSTRDSIEYFLFNIAIEANANNAVLADAFEAGMRAWLQSIGLTIAPLGGPMDPIHVRSESFDQSFEEQADDEEPLAVRSLKRPQCPANPPYDSKTFWSYVTSTPQDPGWVRPVPACM